MAISMMESRRGRTLAILGGATLLCVAVAVGAVYQRSASLAPQFEARALFPDLTKQLEGLSEIEVASKTGTIHIRQTDGRWVVVERDSYPADAGQVRTAGTGIAGLQIVEAKTARPELLSVIGLGAPPAGLMRLVMRQAMSLAAIGGGAGLAAAMVLTPLLANQLYGVGSWDPLTMAAVCATLFAVAALASVMPARRVLRVDPIVTLRAE